MLSSAGTAGAEPPTRADPRRQLPVESGGCGTGAEPRPGSGVRFSGSSGIKPTSELRRTERAGSETHSENPPERGTDLCWSGIPPRKAQPKTPEDRGVIHGARLPLPSGRCPTPQPTQPRRQVRPRLPPCPGSWRLPEPHTCRPQGRGRIEGVRRERRPQTRSTTFSAPGKSRSAQSSTTAEHTGSAPRGRTREGLGAGPPLWIDSRPGQWEDRIRLPPPAREGRYCRPAVEGEGVSMTSRAAPHGQVGRAALRRCGDGERDRGAKSGLSPAAGQGRAYCAPRGWGTELIPLRLWGGLRAEGLAAASAVLRPRSAEEKRGAGSAAAGWVSPTRTAVLPWALP